MPEAHTICPIPHTKKLQAHRNILFRTKEMPRGKQTPKQHANKDSLDGERVSVEGMSDGTKDQLYLALRLASIDKYVQENEPIPFIVDDILIHFDDERAKETLKVLLELSKKTQVIFFTHHSRLIELMKDIASEDQFQLEQLTKLVGV